MMKHKAKKKIARKFWLWVFGIKLVIFIGVIIALVMLFRMFR